jgi:hypothetical protein
MVKIVPLLFLLKLLMDHLVDYSLRNTKVYHMYT